MAEHKQPEFEDSIVELEESFDELNIGKHTHNATKSVLGISLTQFNLENHISEDTEKYKESLKQEQKLWETLLRTAKLQLTELKQPQLAIDESALSTRNRDYLRKSPVLTNFIRDSIEFRQIANVFLEECEEMLEIQRNIYATCEIQLIDKQWNKIGEHLSNKLLQEN